MKKAKKVVALMLCAVMLVAGSVAGTMAYLTSQTGVVTNTFTVGKVAITLNEAAVDVYGVAIDDNKDGTIDDKDRRTENAYKLVPGHEYLKDPKVFVSSDSEESYLFVKVVNGIEAIEAAGDTTIAKQMEKTWIPVEGREDVYRYYQTVTAGNVITVFNNFTVGDTADVSTYSDDTITIQACAVQKDGLTAEAAANEATFN